MKLIFKKLLDLLNGLAILGLAISYLSPFVDPRDFWPVAFFGLTFKLWFGLNLVLLVFWIWRRKSRWKYNALFLLIGFQFAARNFQLFNEAEKSADHLKVVSFNTYVQQIYAGGNTTEQISDYLTENKHDVALLVEWYNRKGNIDIEAFPHQVFIPIYNGHRYGMRFVSKHNILHWERIKYDHFSNNIAAFFDVEVKGNTYRFVSVHLQSNGISSKDYHTLMKVEQDEEYKKYAYNVVGRLRRNILKRAEQTETILSVINSSPYPVIILGDFNDTPQSYTYQQLKGGRKDAFVEKGSRWGATFLKPFPLLRIDYILHDEELTCTSYDCITDIKSDHALVEASFKLSE